VILYDEGNGFDPDDKFPTGLFYMSVVSFNLLQLITNIYYCQLLRHGSDEIGD